MVMDSVDDGEDVSDTVVSGVRDIDVVGDNVVVRVTSFVEVCENETECVTLLDLDRERETVSDLDCELSSESDWVFESCCESDGELVKDTSGVVESL
jgi:hypothetical protein